MTERKPRFLGLDIATTTGWALVEGDRLIRSGVRDFSVKSSEHIGNRGIKFYNFLREIGFVDEIFYEEIQFGGGFKNAQGRWISTTNDGRELYHGMLMVLNMYCASLGIQATGIHPSTLKKQFTGRGDSKKEDMCRVAHELGWKGGEPGTTRCHDEADAIALLVTQLKNWCGIKVIF